MSPDEFAEWKRLGERELGFPHVEAGPLVRSSYHAKEQARDVEAGGPGRIREVMESDLAAPAELLPRAQAPVPDLVQIVYDGGSRPHAAGTKHG